MKRNLLTTNQISPQLESRVMLAAGVPEGQTESLTQADEVSEAPESSKLIVRFGNNEAFNGPDNFQTVDVNQANGNGSQDRFDSLIRKDGEVKGVRFTDAVRNEDGTFSVGYTNADREVFQFDGIEATGDRTVVNLSKLLRQNPDAQLA